MEDAIKVWVGIGIAVLILAVLIAGVFSVIDFFILVGWPATIPLLILFVTLLIGVNVFLYKQEHKKLPTFSVNILIGLALFLASIYVVWQLRLPIAMPILTTAKEFGPDRAGLHLRWWPNLLPVKEEKGVARAIGERTTERRKKYHFQAVQDFDVSRYQESKAHRGKKCLIVWMDDARPAIAFFTSPILASNLEDASSVVWLKSNIEKTGKYYIKSDIILKKKVVYSVRVTYRAHVVDLNKKQVIAYKEFVGPAPPKEISEKQTSPVLDYDRTSDAYGITPRAELISWLESLPITAK